VECSSHQDFDEDEDEDEDEDDDEDDEDDEDDDDDDDDDVLHLGPDLALPRRTSPLGAALHSYSTAQRWILALNNLISSCIPPK